MIRVIDIRKIGNRQFFLSIVNKWMNIWYTQTDMKTLYLVKDELLSLECKDKQSGNYHRIYSISINANSKRLCDEKFSLTIRDVNSPLNKQTPSPYPRITNIIDVNHEKRPLFFVMLLRSILQNLNCDEYLIDFNCTNTDNSWIIKPQNRKDVPIYCLITKKII